MRLSEQLGIAQQTLAHYEADRLRLLAGALPTLAEQLSVSVEDLIGVRPKRSTSKRGPAPKLQQQLERIQSLPSAEQAQSSACSTRCSPRISENSERLKRQARRIAGSSFKRT